MNKRDFYKAVYTWPSKLTFIFFALIIVNEAIAKPLTGTISLLKHQSSVEFTAIGNPSMLTIVGKGDDIEGKVILTGSSGPHGGEIIFNLNSLDTGITKRNEHMKEKYLEVKKNNGEYSKAILKLTKLELPDQENFIIENLPFEANLLLHGQNKPIKGTVIIEKKFKSIFGTARFNLKMGDFGIAIPNYAGITVGEDVSININFSGTIQ